MRHEGQRLAVIEKRSKTSEIIKPFHEMRGGESLIKVGSRQASLIKTLIKYVAKSEKNPLAV